MKIVSKTDVGRVRLTNEDTLVLGRGLYGIADGMGGHRGGNIASSLAAETLVMFLHDRQPSERMLEIGIAEANRAVFERQLADPNLEGMGTTLTVLWEVRDRVIIGHVGDSRAYLFRDGKLTQMTDDHSLVAEMVRQGSITEQEARVHPYRNMITRAVGTDRKVLADIFQQEKRRGDIWLLCSDGLTEYITGPELEKTLKSCPIGPAADKMLAAALDGGGRDNVSLILAEA